jgi:hypothetical protein
MQQAFQQGSTAFSKAGPGAIRVAFTNYNMQGDSMTLVFNTAQKGIQSVQVSSYLNNDPKDAVTFSAQFAKLPDGTNHMAYATVNGEKKQLSIRIQNTDQEGAMKKMLLAFTALGEAAAGAVLLAYPTLAVRLLFGVEIAGAGLVMSRLRRHLLHRLGSCLLAGNRRGLAALRHVDVQHTRDALSHCRRVRRRICGEAVVAGRRPPRDSDGSSRLGLVQRTKDADGIN